MKRQKEIIIIVGIFIAAILFTVWTTGGKTGKGEGATTILDVQIGQEADLDVSGGGNAPATDVPDGEAVEEDSDDAREHQADSPLPRTSEREVLVTERVTLPVRSVGPTENVKHSIPLDEIFGGGPPKDGIPSIDNPQFAPASEASEWLEDTDIGLGLFYKGEARFYPYRILVWHELANDVVAGDPLLISYCPLCLTGVVFDRTVDGVAYEFGVSGMLWKSNLLMYNRASTREKESLWSQVLGEAVLGEFTGTKLAIVPSDAVRFGDWKAKHPDTQVLSRDTGTLFRDYDRDPYGDYYTSEAIYFPTGFNDDELHQKAYVLGIEIGNSFKAYPIDAIPQGTTEDAFAGETIIIEKSDIDEVRFFRGDDRKPIPAIAGFWFSWLAVHPDTELYK